MTHTSKGFKAKPYSICDADSPGPEHEHRRITLLKLDTFGWMSGSKVNKRRLTLPRIRQASAASCSTPVLLLEWSWKRNQPNYLNKTGYFGGALILFHVVVWCIWSGHVSVSFTLSRQHGVEGRPSGSASGPALLPRYTPHRYNLSWCHLFVSVRETEGNTVLRRNVSQHTLHPLFNILFYYEPLS